MFWLGLWALTNVCGVMARGYAEPFMATAAYKRIAPWDYKRMYNDDVRTEYWPKSLVLYGLATPLMLLYWLPQAAWWLGRTHQRALEARREALTRMQREVQKDRARFLPAAEAEVEALIQHRE